MSDLGALVYLEWRMLVNRVRYVLRQPARLIMWAFFLLWIVYVTVGRVFRGGYYNSAVFALPHHLAAAAVALFPALYLTLIGYTIMNSTSRPPAAFAYPA